MAEILAHFTNGGVPLVGPSPLPTIRIRRTDTGALVITDSNMTEVGDGSFTFTFSPVADVDYAVRADGDPTASGQTTIGERYKFGSVSGTIAVVDVQSIQGSALAAILLGLAARTMAQGTITVVNSATSFEVLFGDGFDPEVGDGIAGRGLLFTSGTNIKGAGRVSALNGQGAGNPLLTVTYATNTPATPTVGDTIILT